MAQTRPTRRHPPKDAIDVDEVAPGRFLLHNPRAAGLIKNEGVIDGRLFTLTTWRRDGLLARLRDHAFVVRTIADRIRALPGPPPAPRIGEPNWRAQTSPIEQFTCFDPQTLHWQPVAFETRDGLSGVQLAEGSVVRRRKGRGAWSYFLAFRERGGGNGLRALDPTTAVLIGYAQAMAYDSRPWLVEERENVIVLPEVELPPPHRELLLLFARTAEDGWVVERESGWPLAQALFERLGVQLKVSNK